MVFISLAAVSSSCMKSRPLEAEAAHTTQMMLSGAQGTVAQSVKELFVSKRSELGLRISELLIVIWLLNQCCQLP